MANSSHSQLFHQLSWNLDKIWCHLVSFDSLQVAVCHISTQGGRNSARGERVIQKVTKTSWRAFEPCWARQTLLTFWRQEEMHREYENTELNVKWFEKIFLRTFLGSSLSSWLHWGGVGSTGSKRRVSKCYKRIKYKHYKNQRYNSWKYHFTLLFKKKL